MVLTPAKQTHINPVYASYFADPFVFTHQGIYYAIGTGASEAAGQPMGKIFPILQSTDFYRWQFASSALVRPEAVPGRNFWAPEIAFCDGIFHLYYSVGEGDQGHQLRVATSVSPQGPYLDCGRSLLNEYDCPFAIDAHPFLDEDGKWYLFYARDFLDFNDQVRAGTGLMVARLKTMVELEDAGNVVMRARSDWQRFRAQRSLYGQVWDWHTLEGPFVWKRQGRYYCFYSGGCWENDSYGVDFGVAERVMGPYSDAGNEAGPRVLRTVPEHVVGPGHCSVVVGPDQESEYLVYHAWDKEMRARRMFIDRLVWSESGPRCEGPTWGPGFEARPGAQ